MEQDPFTTPAREKKWLKPAIIAGTVIVVAIITTIVIVATNQPKEPAKQDTAQGSEEFQMTTGSEVKYAGNPVYDACALIPFDVIRENVNNYQKLLDMNGTDQKPTEPLTVEHNYIDRNIAQPLGQDGQPRPTGTTIGGSGKDANAFISTSDSNCWYGQGDGLSIGSGKTFAKVYITQKPTPLSADFTAYVATLQKAASAEGLDMYVEPQADSSGFYTGIVTKPNDGVAVIFKTSTKKLAEKAGPEVARTLSKAPKGPMNLTYPGGWGSMPNPCSLLTADDFQKITGKPASALAEDEMTLNEIGRHMMQRRCERLEIERLDGTPIAKTYAVVRVGNTEGAAKQYVDDVKKDESDNTEVQPLKQKINVADDAYVTVARKDSKVTAYDLNVRVGAAVISLSTDLETGVDASADAFVARMLPIARSAAEKYRNS